MNLVASVMHLSNMMEVHSNELVCLFDCQLAGLCVHSKGVHVIQNFHASLQQPMAFEYNTQISFNLYQFAIIIQMLWSIHTINNSRCCFSDLIILKLRNRINSLFTQFFVIARIVFSFFAAGIAGFQLILLTLCKSKKNICYSQGGDLINKSCGHDAGSRSILINNINRECGTVFDQTRNPIHIPIFRGD